MSRRSGFVLIGLLAVTAAGVYIASSTDIGFPYRPKTNVQRVPYLVSYKPLCLYKDTDNYYLQHDRFQQVRAVDICSTYRIVADLLRCWSPMWISLVWST